SEVSLTTATSTSPPPLLSPAENYSGELTCKGESHSNWSIPQRVVQLTKVDDLIPAATYHICDDRKLYTYLNTPDTVDNSNGVWVWGHIEHGKWVGKVEEEYVPDECNKGPVKT